jgi:hypothetical protein
MNGLKTKLIIKLLYTLTGSKSASEINNNNNIDDRRVLLVWVTSRISWHRNPFNESCTAVLERIVLLVFEAPRMVRGAQLRDSCGKVRGAHRSLFGIQVRERRRPSVLRLLTGTLCYSNTAQVQGVQTRSVLSFRMLFPPAIFIRRQRVPSSSMSSSGIARPWSGHGSRLVALVQALLPPYLALRTGRTLFRPAVAGRIGLPAPVMVRARGGRDAQG